jgi:retinol dehydrogenase-12
VGTHVSRILYSRNATVYISGRSESKANFTTDQIKDEVPKSTGKLVFFKVDLSDLTTIKAAAEEFTSKETKLHWLDNNAGVMIPPKDSKGAQGLDLQYQTNILGPFLLTKVLLPILLKTAQSKEKGSVRVSWAGSLAIYLQAPKGGVQWKDGTLAHALNSPPTAYGVSKAANYFLAYEFGRRFSDKDHVLHNVSSPRLPKNFILTLSILQSRFSQHGTIPPYQNRIRCNCDVVYRLAHV